MDKRQNLKKYAFGLIGKNIDYSFSKAHFEKKFKKHQFPYTYQNFDINHIEQFKNVINSNDHLKGLNVTIPYKESIISYLDKLSKKAKKIGAVNTIKISSKGKLIGYNTDCYGFKKSIMPLIEPHHKKALILGTGGSSKAIIYVLNALQIQYNFVSRSKNKANYTYNLLSEKIIKSHQIIINCSPLGTYPKVKRYPLIPYNFITKDHLLFDLIYNPEETMFLSLGRQQGAKTTNGLKMLKLQAKKSWKIWTKGKTL